MKISQKSQSIVIRKTNQKTIIFPIPSPIKTNSVITGNFENEINKQEPNELSIANNLLDKQVIDLVGNKVVRVNDVAIQDQPHLAVSGIDISFLGLLRRLGIEDEVQKLSHTLRFSIHEQLLSWGDIQIWKSTGDKSSLKKERVNSPGYTRKIWLTIWKKHITIM